MAQKTGIAVNPETVRLHLRAAGIILRNACRGNPATWPLLKEDAAASGKSRLCATDSKKRAF